MKYSQPKAILLLVVLSVMLAACIPDPAIPAVTPTQSVLPPTEAVEDSAAIAPIAAPTLGPAECKPGLSAIQPPTAEQAAMVAMIPPVNANDFVRGPADAAVTIIEYTDYQCPYCAQFDPVVEQLLNEFTEDVRVVFRHFPLPSHPNSMLATQAVEAAGLQGKMYELSGELFKQQSTWSPMDSASLEAFFVDLAATLGLNKDQFTEDLKSDAVVQKTLEYQKQAMDAGVGYTPFIMVNGRVWEGTDLVNMRILIKLLREDKNLFSDCPPTILEPGKQYQAVFETEAGSFVLDLNTDHVPISANAFVWLVEQGWYDNTSFFNVIRGDPTQVEIALTGDHTETGYGTAGFSLSPEIVATLKFDKAGKVGFVNGSQLFITYGELPMLDGRYTVMGEVVEGMDVVEKLAVTTLDASGNLTPGTKIIKVSITTK